VGPRAGAGAKLARQALACVVIARPGVGARASTFRVAFARTPASLELKPSTPNKRPELEVSERGKVGHRAQPRALPKALATKH
jgi:hypothetical protein